MYHLNPILPHVSLSITGSLICYALFPCPVRLYSVLFVYSGAALGRFRRPAVAKWPVRSKKLLALCIIWSYNPLRLVPSGLWLQADASRRLNGPRNPSKVTVSMVRSRCKSVRVFPREGREGAVALSKLPDGVCGVKDQVSRRETTVIIIFWGFPYHVRRQNAGLQRLWR